MNYLVVAVMCNLALLVGVISLQENEMISLARKRALLRLAPLLIFEITLDTIAFGLEGRNVDVILFRSIKIMEFMLAPIIPALMAQAIARRYYWAKIEKYFYALISINAVFELLNYVIPLAFVITSEVEYQRTIIGYLYLLNLSLCMVLLIKCSMNAFVQNSTVSRLLISMILFTCISIVLRIFLDKCNCDWLAITFCYFSIIQLHDNNYLKVDGLTKLLNRKAYDNKVKTINYRTALIIIDADNFKSINDEHGHDYGDWALAKYSEAILKVYSEDGYCYRYGGDEFTVILKEGVIQRWQEKMVCQDKYMLVQELTESLDGEISRMIEDFANPKEKEIFLNGVSQGFGIYLPDLNDDSYQKSEQNSSSQSVEEDTSKLVGRTWEEVFQIADKRLYEEKRKRAIKRTKTQ